MLRPTAPHPISRRRDELDAKDPVSGTLSWGPSMRVKFALNYERIPGIGFDEKCMHSKYEVRRRPGNFLMHMAAGDVDIVMSNTILAEGKVRRKAAVRELGRERELQEEREN